MIRPRTMVHLDVKNMGQSEPCPAAGRSPACTPRSDAAPGPGEMRRGGESEVSDGGPGEATDGRRGEARRAERGGDTATAAGLDLHLDLTGPRRRAAVEAALRQAVQSGRLPAGTRLPATRTLAADLGIARNTVADAYGQLVAEGWLTARQGSGTHVSERAAATRDAAAEPAAMGPRIRY